MCPKAVLDEITRRIAGEAKRVLGDRLDKVILYGSYARGDCDDESDIDIMVLADIPREETGRARELFHELTDKLNVEYEYEYLISLNVTDCATFYEWLNVLPFYKNVINDGVICGG
jgi:predicted nucleotidyltransferase